MTNRINPKQKRLLIDLEKGEKSVDLIFQDHKLPTERLDDWLASRSFLRAIERMRGRMKFRLDQELYRGAMMGSKRLANATYGGGSGGAGEGIAKMVEMQACVNAIRLFLAVVQNPEMRKRANAEMRAWRQRKLEGLSFGYHPKHTPEKAAALLKRIHKEHARPGRPELFHEEDGHYVHAD